MKSPLRLLLTSCFCLALAAPKAASQDTTDLDLGTAYDRAVAAIDSGNYDAGLKSIDTAITEYGSRALDDYGPVFGHFYYLRGMLYIKKKEYPRAIEALKISFEKYNNDVLKDATRDDPRLPNRYRVHALYQWGSCEMALENYEKAADLYQQALELDKVTEYEPKVNRFEIMINLAKAFLNSGKLDQAKKFLTDNLEKDYLTDDTKRGLFMLLATDWSPKVPYAEVRDVLEKYDTIIRTEDVASRYQRRDSRFMGLASQAIQDNDLIRALAWYGMVAPPGEVIRRYENRITELKQREVPEEYQKRKDEQIAELEKELPNLRKQLASMYLGISACHYQLGSLAGARGAYKELADNFPKHDLRATILHNLVVSDVNLGLWKEAYKYGVVFFKEFPDHELKPSVARVLVEVLFIEGDYQEAYEVASDVRQEMELGSDIRDIPDFVTGASLYHLGRFDEAEVELQSYLDNYPEGKRLEPIEFYIGACKTNLFKWSEAAPLLDGFITKYQQSEMRPSALYLSGLTHLVVENYNDSLSRVTELQSKYRGAEEIPASYNIKGDVLSAQAVAFNEYSESYKEAKRMVEEDGRGDPEVAGYALRQLISGAVEEAQFEMAGDYYNQFKEKYESTSWRTDASVAALPALVELGRKDEARALLEAFVNELGSQPGSPAFDEMFGAYADFMTENYELDEVRQRYNAFPAEPSPPPPAIRAWLLMGEIEALEAVDKEKYKGDIDQIFYQLNALQEKEGGSMSNYTLVRLARWNLQERGKVEDARRVYDFILSERPDGEALGFALIDTAKLDAESGDKASRNEALIKFERVLEQIDKASLREEATLGIARIYTKNEDWPKAREWWATYTEDTNHRMARPEANYRYAQAVEKLGQPKEALKLYVQVYANFAGHLDWSTPAYLNSAKILEDDGRLLDALKVLKDMLQRMGHLEHENIEKGREMFGRIRDAYSATL